MDVQIKRDFKSYSVFPTKKFLKKEDSLCMKFFSTPNTSVQRYLKPLFQNQRPLFQLPLLFGRISQNLGQD